MESQTLLINTQAQELLKQNRDIIKFGFGQSPFKPPKSVLKGLREAVKHKEYSSVQGDPHLREVMAEFHWDHNNLKVKPENILIGPGSKILIFNILLAFTKADVFIPSPSWVSYAPQAELAGHHVIRIPTTYDGRWRITPDSIRGQTRNKRYEMSIMILNYPGNPDGLTYAESELQELAKCAKELDILVISDEIYGLLDYSFNHKSFSTYYPEKTITTTGLSKWCGAGGWRFGAAFLYEGIDSDLRQTLIGIGSETYSCAPMPVQMAAKIAYGSFHDLKDYLYWQIDVLRQIGEFCSEQLNSYDIRVHIPQGGFYLFPDFSLHAKKLLNRGIKTSNDLCKELLSDRGVAMLPASAFGFHPEFLGCRLAYVDFLEPSGKTKLNLTIDCPRIVKGINNIGNWISQ